MPLPVVPTDSDNEKQHRTVIATVLNEIVKGVESGTFQVTLTGVDATVTGTAYFQRFFDLVTLFLPSLSGTSNATTCTITGVPQSLRPTRAQGLEHPVIADNGSFALGAARIGTDGVITVYDDSIASSATGWTNIGTKFVDSWNYTFLRN